LRLLVISNRVPAPSAREGAGGLAVALRDALSESGGVWFGWSGQRTPERADEPSVVREDGVSFATLPLTDDDFNAYYCGYANSVLWPLFHERLHAMDYHDSYQQSYQDVNEYFADHAARLVEPGDVIWIHDYQVIPLGANLRRRGVDCRMGFFLHIPFPPHDLFRALPDRRELLRTFLAYDLVGFQTPGDARNFADALTQDLGADVDIPAGLAELDGRQINFGAYPIGIDVEGTSRTALRNRSSNAGLRLTRALRDRKLVIGADRLDYTKGLVERFQAFEIFLERYREEIDDKMIYVQITAPSRENVEEYQEITMQLEAETGRINGRNNTIYWTPLRLIEQQVPRSRLLGYFSLAHVGLITPLRDGMNLVAKEFVAAQTEENPGVLVLSSMAGAVEELAECAVVVNPYDGDSVAEGIHQALNMGLEERRERWKTSMSILRSNTAEIWRERFLDQLLSRPATDSSAAG